jgi:hypothetical protein
MRHCIGPEALRRRARREQSVTEILLKTVHVSWFTSAHETKANYEITVNWLGLVGLLTNPLKRRITGDEKTVPLVSFARFEGERSSGTIKAITALDLNFDGVAKYETIRRNAKDYEFVAYSAHGHTEDKPKFRFILLPSREITPAEWPKMQAMANSMLGNKADETTRDAAHIFAVPSAAAKNREIAFAHYNHGRLLDPDLLLSAKSASRSLGSLSSADFVSIATVKSASVRRGAARRGYQS